MPKPISLFALIVLSTGSCTPPPPSDAPRTQQATRDVHTPAPHAATSPDRSIRVAILPNVSDCLIAIRQPFDVFGEDGTTPLATIDHPEPLTVSFAGETIRFSPIDRTFNARAIELRPRSGGVVAVRRADRLRPYRGHFRLIRRSESAGAVVNVVDIEDYLLGVVPSEVPKDFAPAALHAQAIVARTFAWYQKEYRGSLRDWDVYDNESSQVYGGLDAEQQSAEQLFAVRQSAGIVCTWTSPEGERIFPTYYSSTCGGVTRVAPQQSRGEPKYTVLAGDVTCDYCSQSSYYRWPTVSISKKLINERLRATYPRIASMGPITDVAVSRWSAKGRPLRIAVFDTSRRSENLDIEDFRLCVDPSGVKLLKSGFFKPITQRDTILFTDGRGYGHGEGLCQYGADGLARSGKSATEILTFYYPGSHVARAY